MTAHIHAVTTVMPECCRVCSHHRKDEGEEWCEKNDNYFGNLDTCPPSWCPLPLAQPVEDEAVKLLREAATAIDALRGLLMRHHDVGKIKQIEWGMFCPVCVHDRAEDPALDLAAGAVQRINAYLAGRE
jgi:hypothetical protein